MRKIIVMFLLLWVAMPVLSQKNKSLLRAVEAAVGRQAAEGVLPKNAPYHPVFGYIYPNIPNPPHKDGAITPFIGHLYDTFKFMRLIQVAPLTQPLKNIHTDKNFVVFEKMTIPQVAQATYLYRLAHPESSQEKYMDAYPGLMALAEEVYAERVEHYFSFHDLYGWMDMIELPSLQFLQRLADPNFTPKSYAQLAEEVSVYPKHITLNEQGFPVKTAEAEYASILDNYLVLSNPKEMNAFVNVYKYYSGPRKITYTPFVLTKEEHAAADKLLALRQAGDKLPKNPTPRDLLELAYNRLATHAVPYTKINENRAKDYKTYPNYKNTRLYHSIKGMIKDQIPLESLYQGYYTLENVDMTHLIVLDAVMGGVDPDNLKEVRRALNAFDKLCAEVHPKDEQAIAHLAILQKNLQVVFYDLIRFNDQQKDWIAGEDPEWLKAELAGYAYSLLEGRNIYSLVGRNWQQRY